eukprot:NODE_523_length_7257_cov_0.781922.p6 type:complete len:105 gc:universal NODE_523_length_7257_cov_0.781922:4167-4481(+)
MVSTITPELPIQLTKPTKLCFNSLSNLIRGWLNNLLSFITGIRLLPKCGKYPYLNSCLQISQFASGPFGALKSDIPISLNRQLYPYLQSVINAHPYSCSFMFMY